jgi:CheY-like chemotaxis protein
MSPQFSRFLQGMTLVIVEDHRDTRELYATALRKRGAEVLEAASAQMALLLIEQAAPDLVLLDIELPDLNGYDLLQAVRRLPTERIRNTSFVALSVRNQTHDRAESLMRGCRLHISKPIDPEELARIVGGLLTLDRD